MMFTITVDWTMGEHQVKVNTRKAPFAGCFRGTEGGWRNQRSTFPDSADRCSNARAARR